MSEYEKIGIDLEAIQDGVITDKRQLQIDEIQEKFLKICRPDSSNMKEIPLKDFIGTITPTLREGVEAGNIKTWEDLMHGLKRMDENVKSHSEEYLFSDDNGKEPIGLEGINGKYFVVYNGNHRMTILKLRYLTEIKRANGNQKRLEEIESEYKIKVTRAVNVPEDKEELIGIILLGEINNIQQNENRISELVDKGEKVGYTIQEKDKKITIKSKDELKQYIQQKLEEIQQNSEQYAKFIKNTKYCKVNEKYSETFKIITGMEKTEEQLIDKNQNTEIDSNNGIDEQVIELEQPEEESIRDELKSEKIDKEKEKQENINLWMNRFKKWDLNTRFIPEGIKKKFITMKSDVMKTIKDIIKNKKQEQNIEAEQEEKNV